MYLLWIILVAASLHAGHKFTNALIDAQSPYLLQHAHNPVDWKPYSEAVFQEAKKEHKLIFLSIGYSTCHWCHVMEKESFENEKMASLLNHDYISVKVDKEEMPQIDSYYQHLHSLLNHGRNGWPLNLFLTPEKEIIYSATYIPLVDSYGVEGMETLVPKFARLYHENPKKLQKIIAENKKLIRNRDTDNAVVDDQNISKRYVGKMLKRFDRIYKGFDRRPRFPLASNLRLLLDIYLLSGNQSAWKMTEQSLSAMARGGIYDQIEGGFFRYTTDQDWIIPHFEKMLYTNAELIPLYVRAYLLTKKPLFKKVVQESIHAYHHRFEQNHLFFGASDADTLGEEGGYFIYDYQTVFQALQKAHFTPEEIAENLEYFDITQTGNFKEGKSNVHFNTGFDAVPKRAGEVKSILKQMRQKRTYPFVDQKIITSWNAMMIKALFKASVLDTKYLEEGLHSLDALLAKNYRNGILYHQSIGQKKPLQKALLEDYAFLIDSLLEAYMQTYRHRYLSLAETFAQDAQEKLYLGGIWYLNEGQPKILSQYNDKYYTTALARMFHNLLTLSALTYDVKLYALTQKMIKDEKNKILRAFDKSPEALRALIRLKYGDIVLKSRKENLWKYGKEIASVRYPFLLRKEEKTDSYMLCNMQSCFYFDKNLTKAIKQIK